MAAVARPATLAAGLALMLRLPLASGARSGVAFPRRSCFAPQPRQPGAPPARSCLPLASGAPPASPFPLHCAPPARSCLPLASCRGNPVSDAAYGLDPHSGARELGPQPGQVNVDGIRAEGVGLVVPDMLSDRAAVGDARGSPHENLQDAELSAGQGGPLPADQHLPCRRIELEFPD